MKRCIVTIVAALALSPACSLLSPIDKSARDNSDGGRSADTDSTGIVSAPATKSDDKKKVTTSGPALDVDQAGVGNVGIAKSVTGPRTTAALSASETETTQTGALNTTINYVGGAASAGLVALGFWLMASNRERALRERAEAQQLFVTLNAMLVQSGKQPLPRDYIAEDRIVYSFWRRQTLTAEWTPLRMEPKPIDAAH